MFLVDGERKEAHQTAVDATKRHLRIVHESYEQRAYPTLRCSFFCAKGFPEQKAWRRTSTTF